MSDVRKVGEFRPRSSRPPIRSIKSPTDRATIVSIYPKLIEEVNITTKEITVEKPIYVDVEVKVPVFQEYVIANPVLKNVEVINAVIADKTVINAVITDMQITNAIIKDIEVERAIIREKVIDVIHPIYLKINGDLDE